MLSAARRVDARRGLGGMEEDNDLEEGEAYSGQEDGRCIDPDALSYIDEKIQDVLGHFQKDFEAGVSAENLGAKFGGYGSFLPTYQRSPSILCHPKSPHKVGHQNVTKSPSVEVTNQNTSVMLNSSFPKSNATAVSLVGNSCTRDISTNKPNTQDPSSLRTPFSKTADGSDHKTPKLRIKVGPENNLARNNAAIYSGLGLDISPSSSSEESPDGSNEIFPEPHDTSDESPRTILQVMTSFPIPGVNLLSPLHDCLFHSIEKDLPLNKPYKQGKLSKERSETTSGFIDFSIHSRESNGQPEKPTKLSQQNGRSKGAKYLEDKGAVILNREIGIEARPAQELASNSFGRVSSNSKNIKKAEGQIGENTTIIETKTLDYPLDIRKDLSRDKPITGPTKDRQFELVDSTIDNGSGYSVNRINQSKGKLSEKTSMTERALEDRNADFQKNGKSDLQREVRLKTDKDSEIPNADISGEKRRNEQVAEAADHTKQSSPFKVMVLQRKDQLSDKKSKVITSQSDSGEVVKASVCGSLATALNEKKKNLEKKSKGKKSLKYPRSCANESHGNSNWVVKAEETGVGSSNNLKVKNKAMKRKDEESILPSQPVKERSGGKKMGSTLALGTSVGEPVPVPLTCNAPAADTTIVPQASIVIEENWVQCDICQKWRLLPYGTNPGHLPSKWQCNLLNWLPGMNSCHFSEDDTTNALHALYIAPTSENVASLDGFGHSVASTSLASGVHLGVPTIKKKSSQKDASILNQSISTEFPIAVKKEDQISVNDTNQYLPSEINSSNKGTVGTLGKSVDFREEKHKPKQKDKHKNHGFYPSGGNQSEKNEKHSKSKGKRMIDQDGLRTPKKHKKESLQSLEYDIKGNPSPSSNKVRNDVQFFNNGQIKDHLSTSDVEKSLSTKKKLMRHESHHNQKGFMTSQNEDNRVNIKEIFSESESVQDKKADLLTFEGKISKTNNLNNRMDKKQTISRTVLAANGDYLPDEMDEEATNLVEKECPSRQSQENVAFSRDLDFGSSRRDSMKTRGTNSVQPSLAANSSSSKVSGSQKSRSNLPESKGSPVESVSSSPLRIPIMEKQSCKKVSDKKYDTNTDRSVLRSPKRCLDVEVDGRNRPSAKRRKDMVSSFQKQSIEGHKAANSAILDSLGGTVDYLEKGRTRSTVGKYEEKPLVKQSVHDKLLPIENGENPYKDVYQDIKKVNRQHQVVDPTHRTSGKSFKSSSGFKEKHRDSKSDSDKSRLKASCSHSDNKDLNSANNARSYRLEVTTDSCRNEKDDIHGKYAKDCSLKKGHSSRWMTSKADNSLTFALQDNMDTNGPPMLSSQQRNLDSKNSITGVRSLKPEFQVTPLEHEKTMNQNGSHKTCILVLLSGQEKSEFKLDSGDKQETQAPDIVSSPLKQRRSDGEMVDAVTTDALKVGKQHKDPDSHTGVHHSHMRHALPSGPDTSSPTRKENHTLLVKEARDLKHTANRLKIEGREIESTSLFFQAALKFLHIASLMEAATFDSAKLAEAAQMYFETAKLCEFVARECERIKDMASAALAYKCIEVAFLKAAYCKNPNASRDRHELQTAFQFLPPGESPSSSASDVDNLNNQALLGKNASVKGVSSPQVAGNHILAARHHLQVMRLLHYANDLNCAFEATRKSQISIAAASANLDKDRPDTLSSVRKALDFNFHDVEGLLRLVRLSLESIGH